MTARAQAVRLLPMRAAWARAARVAAQSVALVGLSYLLVITLLEVAALAARMQP